jgi:hypothetical protein
VVEAYETEESIYLREKEEKEREGRERPGRVMWLRHMSRRVYMYERERGERERDQDATIYLIVVFGIL